MSGQPELVCARCAPVEARTLELDTALRTMQVENTALADELAGARSTTRTLEGQLRAARAENTRLREDGPNAERVKLVLNCWVQGCGTARADVSMSSDRAALVFKMLKHRNCGAKNAEEQALILCRAVKGVALKPYKLFSDRYTNKPGHPEARRLTRLEHCIGSDDRVEENVTVYRNACKTAAELHRGVVEQWKQASALEAELGHLVSLPLAMYEEGKDAEDIVAFLWDRVAERDQFWDDILAAAEPAPESDIARALRETAPVEPVSNVIPIRTEAA